jgi:cysteine desulfurase family protein
VRRRFNCSRLAQHPLNAENRRSCGYAWLDTIVKKKGKRLTQRILYVRRIYLDSAATSFPKPPSVYAAVDDYNRRLGAAIGRGAYRATIEGTAIVQRCRKKLADLLGAESPERVVLTFNCTDSLNLALHGLLRPGDHAITSVVDHNSVQRPLTELHRGLGIEVSRVGADSTGMVEPAEFRRAVRPQTKLIALIHASNVTGTIQPVADVGKIAHEAGALFLVDAAQTAGHLPIDLRELPIDLLAGPGHKGLLGPLGTGFLYIRPGVEARLSSFRQGGTGTQSEEDVQPDSLPDKYESGNHNAPGLVGLEAALTWLLERGVSAVHDQSCGLTRQLLAGLGAIPGLRLFGPPPEHDRVGVVSLTIDGQEPQEVAAILDETFGIETRAGLHCAPGAHRAIGSFATGGTVRLSVGPFTTPDDVSAAVDALQQIAVSSH